MTDVEGIDARPLLTRRMAWDMLPHYLTPAVLKRLGMVPPDDDSQELEHKDSHRRLDPLLEIEDQLVPVLAVAKQVLCGAMLTDQEDDCEQPLTEEAVGEIVRASCVGILAHLVNTQVVQVNDGLKC